MLVLLLGYHNSLSLCDEEEKELKGGSSICCKGRLCYALELNHGITHDLQLHSQASGSTTM